MLLSAKALASIPSTTKHKKLSNENYCWFQLISRCHLQNKNCALFLNELTKNRGADQGWLETSFWVKQYLTGQNDYVYLLIQVPEGHFLLHSPIQSLDLQRQIFCLGSSRRRSLRLGPPRRPRRARCTKAPM